MNKTESREDYLETILLLMRKNGGVRSIDIANELNYSKASISRAVGILKENNYISVDRSGQITFTEEGQKRAEAVYDRHITIKSFLKDIDESFEKIKKLVTENEKKSLK